MDNSNDSKVKTEETDETPPSSLEPTFEPYVDFLGALTHNWSSFRAAKLLTPEILQHLIPRFNFCSLPIKVRILTTFLHIKESLREQCKVELSQLLCDAETDSDDWVRKMSRLLQPYIATGTMDINETDTEAAYKVIKILDNQKLKNHLEFRQKLPLEHCHMCNPLDEEDFNPLAHQHSSESSFGLPLHVAPPYKHETTNFRPSVDLNLLMREIEHKGIQRLLLVSRHLEQSKKKARTSSMSVNSLN